MTNGIGGYPPHRIERRRPRDAILCQWSAGRLRRCSQRRTRGTLHLEAVVGVVLLVEVGPANWRVGAVPVSNLLREKVTMMDGPRLEARRQRRSWEVVDMRVSSRERLGTWLSYVAPCLSHCHSHSHSGSSHSAWAGAGAGADVKGHVKVQRSCDTVVWFWFWSGQSSAADKSTPRGLKSQCAGVASCSCIERDQAPFCIRTGAEPKCGGCCWLLAAGCWLLAAGCWLLADGCGTWAERPLQ